MIQTLATCWINRRGNGRRDEYASDSVRARDTNWHSVSIRPNRWRRSGGAPVAQRHASLIKCALQRIETDKTQRLGPAQSG